MMQYGIFSMRWAGRAGLSEAAKTLVLCAIVILINQYCLHYRTVAVWNKYVGHPYCRVEMYAGRVACCPWWAVSVPTGQTDRQTNRRMDVRALHYAFRSTHVSHNNERLNDIITDANDDGWQQTIRTAVTRFRFAWLSVVSQTPPDSPNCRNNNNNKRICIEPLGRNFRGAGATLCYMSTGKRESLGEEECL